MAKISIPGGGAGGLDPDELTAVEADVRKGKIAGVNGSDDPVTGTLDIPAASILAGKSIGGVAGTATKDADATVGYIYSGKTAYVNGSKLTGTMTVNSILNFSAAAYSTSQILLQWQNPYAAAGKPFSGVFINYSTGGYPGMWGGTRIYTGIGNNAASGGWSQAIVTMPSVGTGYYFSATAYCICSAGDLYGNTINAYAATAAHGSKTFTYSQTWTVPAGVRTVDVCCVGGGGGGGGGAGRDGGKNLFGGGGGGGYVNNIYGIAITPGQEIYVTVGGGGLKSGYNNAGTGGRSMFGSYASANGGASAHNGDAGDGGAGGSGGGSGWPDKAYSGGSDGSDGQGLYGGKGQGFTTRAFGGTLYAGGGAGVWSGTGKNWSGGAGGGGSSNAAGAVNTGGGGGGGNNYYQPGGSGIVIIRW